MKKTEFLHFMALIFSDINECAKATHKCSANAVCNNTKGSYNCTCNSGYYGDGWNCQGRVCSWCWVILKLPQSNVTRDFHIHDRQPKLTLGAAHKLDCFFHALHNDDIGII